MKIVCDRHIPFLVEAVREAWPDVTICPMESEQIDATSLRDADVLVVRTRTSVNSTLLTDTSVRLVCTATIGYDHIDTAWCEAHGIRWMACPGCNAQAVCDYIEEVLNELQVAPTATIGIVGVGHVGSLVAKMAKRKGLRVLLNDPPKSIGVSLDEIAKSCDIVTFHVPLDSSTYHLCDADFLAKTKPGTLIINAARGGVVDEQALMDSGRPFVLDTWENEPHINPIVLNQAQLASMHIAGYSLQGKQNATQMCLDSIAQQFRLPPITLSNRMQTVCNTGDCAPGWVERISTTLKAHPDRFEELRQNYPLR